MTKLLDSYRQSHNYIAKNMFNIWRDKDDFPESLSEKLKDYYKSTMFEIKNIRLENSEELKAHEAKLFMLASDICAKIAKEDAHYERWYSKALSYAHWGIRMAETHQPEKVNGYISYAARQARWAYEDTNQSNYLALWIRNEERSSSDSRFVEEARNKWSSNI